MTQAPGTDWPTLSVARFLRDGHAFEIDPATGRVWLVGWMAAPADPEVAWNLSERPARERVLMRSRPDAPAGAGLAWWETRARVPEDSGALLTPRSPPDAARLAALEDLLETGLPPEAHACGRALADQAAALRAAPEDGLRALADAGWRGLLAPEGYHVFDPEADVEPARSVLPEAASVLPLAAMAARERALALRETARRQRAARYAEAFEGPDRIAGTAAALEEALAASERLATSAGIIDRLRDLAQNAGRELPPMAVPRRKGPEAAPTERERTGGGAPLPSPEPALDPAREPAPEDEAGDPGRDRSVVHAAPDAIAKPDAEPPGSSGVAEAEALPLPGNGGVRPRVAAEAPQPVEVPVPATRRDAPAEPLDPERVATSARIDEVLAVPGPMALPLNRYAGSEMVDARLDACAERDPDALKALYAATLDARDLRSVGGGPLDGREAAEHDMLELAARALAEAGLRAGLLEDARRLANERSPVSARTVAMLDRRARRDESGALDEVPDAERQAAVYAALAASGLGRVRALGRRVAGALGRAAERVLE